METDPGLIRDAIEHPELQVVRIGVPDIVGFHRDGSPMWDIRGGADGGAYHDTRVQPIVADESPITLATTMKSLWPYARTLLPANQFSVGKTYHIKAFGKLTTDGTAGNYTAGIGYGASDAPTALAAGVARAGVTSQSNISFIAEAYFTCRASGATGTLVGWGQISMDLAVQLSTAQPNILPGSALAAVTVDTTAGTNSPVITLQRSGAGVWTATTQAIIFSALN
jgi:hypothetical protein